MPALLSAKEARDIADALKGNDAGLRIALRENEAAMLTARRLATRLEAEHRNAGRS